MEEEEEVMCVVTKTLHIKTIVLGEQALLYQNYWGNSTNPSPLEKLDYIRRAFDCRNLYFPDCGCLYILLNNFLNYFYNIVVSD